MEEVIEELRDRNLPVPVPLELPDHDTLVVVEEEILLPLPREMRQFMLEVGDVICGALEPVTAADPYSHTYLPEVASQAWAQGVPRHLVPLCETHGHYYCVEPEGEVVFWRDGNLTDERWQSVWEWARDVWLDS
ncbi:SMI1/KNR4 family protein [Gilvimarinus xylanilyticus]|uniref:SMI1/KNR4 family protein n=1 Tax=Gilvimarinus xylanilyticus TaxID=2944139 RepID=A0A9X2I1C3_9GAMM|nr:SMI1/KNR4 family protein [Gilvimarinus xylanilyticus]MCP8897757.1 SMI1/KNR4 family protein [Gilvimarinus xylanilyticus]